MKKKKQYKMKTKHLITMMTILCLGLIVLSLSTSFSFAPVRNVLGYVIVPFQNGINEVGTWMTDQKKGFQSMKKLAADCAAGKQDPEEITEQVVASYLDTAGMPDPDLLIRTSGEIRLSNYLLWQLAYTEIYVTDCLWPDFDQEELEKAIMAYNRRDRRYGGVKQA